LVLEKKKANEAKPERTCVGNTEQVQSCEPPEPTSPLWATDTPTSTPLSSFASAPLTLSNLSYLKRITEVRKEIMKVLGRRKYSTCPIS